MEKKKIETYLCPILNIELLIIFLLKKPVLFKIEIGNYAFPSI